MKASERKDRNVRWSGGGPQGWEIALIDGHPYLTHKPHHIHEQTGRVRLSHAYDNPDYATIHTEGFNANRLPYYVKEALRKLLVQVAG